MAAEHFKQHAAKIEALEDKVKSHKRERVLIYDAAMKQVRTGGKIHRPTAAPTGIQRGS